MADVPFPPPPSQPPTWGPRPEGPTARPAPPPRRPRRVFFWFFLALQLLFLVWIVAAVNSAGDVSSCDGLTGAALRACRDGEDAGTVLGVGFLIAVWAAVDVILGITYAVYRLGRRQRS
ncbi:hypothetical protein [Streptomyces yangpuensis]|uniref:hypothetical protein n=1 Tax=Streptomyces yangpuensis TaxID=1648182 RepID=UPI003722834E